MYIHLASLTQHTHLLYDVGSQLLSLPNVKNSMKYKFILPFVSLIFLFAWGVDNIQAQNNPIVITDQDTTISLPDSINFAISAESNTPITRITLVYGANSLSCQGGGASQRMDIETGTTVETDWDWDLDRSGAIPPGATIWWQWEVEDEAGNIEVTERETAVLIDTIHNWQTLTAEGVTVHWYTGNRAFGQKMLTQAINSLENISSQFGVEQPDNIQIWFYESSADVQDAIVNVPEWTGGVAFSEYGITVLGVAPEQDDWAAQIIPHELAHLVVGVRMFNCRGTFLPTWLNEGLARYVEGPTKPRATEALQTALTNGTLPPLRTLGSGFSAYGNQASLSYTQSSEVVGYLINTYGSESIDQLLGLIQSGQTIDNALNDVYGLNTDTLDAEWRTSLGYIPTPTSEADAIALQATPTTIPTLALGGIPSIPATSVAEVTATSAPTHTHTPAPSPTATATEEPSATPEQTDTPVPTRASTPTPPQEGTSGGTTTFIIGGIIILILMGGLWVALKNKS